MYAFLLGSSLIDPFKRHVYLNTNTTEMVRCFCHDCRNDNMIIKMHVLLYWRQSLCHR